MIQKNKVSFPLILFSSSLFIIPLVKSDLFLDGAGLPKLLVYALILTTFSIVAFYKKLSISNRWTKRISIIIVSYVLLSFLAVWSGENHGEALWIWSKNSSQLLILIPAFIVFENTNKKVLFQYFSLAVALANIIILFICLSGFLKILMFEPYGHQITYKITATFGHRNLLAHFLVLSIPFHIIGYLSYNRKIKFLFLFLMIANTFLVFFLLAKSSWIALYIATLQFIILYISKSTKAEFKRIQIVLGLFITISIGLGSYLKYGSNEVFNRQIDALHNVDYGSTYERIDLWKKSLDGILDKPMLGNGLGMWKINIPAEGSFNMRSATGNLFFQRPHNDFIWIAYEQGLFSLVFYLMIFILAALMAFKNLGNAKTFKQRMITISLLSGITAYFLLSLFSFPMERITQAYYFLTFILLLLLNVEQTEINKEKSSVFFLKPVLGFIILLSLSTIALGFSRSKSELLTLKMLDARQKKDWKSTIQYAQKAETYFYKYDLSATPMAWYSGSAYYFLGLKEQAHTFFQEAYSINPYHVHVCNNLGTTYTHFGNYTKAIELYKSSIQKAVLFEDPYYNLSAVYFIQKKYDLAFSNITNMPPELKEKNSEKWNAYLQEITMACIKNLTENVDEPILKGKLQDLSREENWQKYIIEEAITRKNAITEQIITEVLYGMEVMDKSISPQESDFLAGKYIK